MYSTYTLIPVYLLLLPPPSFAAPPPSLSLSLLPASSSSCDSRWREAINHRAANGKLRQPEISFLPSKYRGRLALARLRYARGRAIVRSIFSFVKPPSRSHRARVGQLIHRLPFTDRPPIPSRTDVVENIRDEFPTQVQKAAWYRPVVLEGQRESPENDVSISLRHGRFTPSNRFNSLNEICRGSTLSIFACITQR